jgi:nicotinamide-nucleotide amidase
MAFRQQFDGDRDAVRRQSVGWALQTLSRQFLQN